jgi:hypothetical protein
LKQLANYLNAEQSLASRTAVPTTEAARTGFDDCGLAPITPRP